MAGEERKLEETPTWAVAVVCLVIIGISLLLELFLHKVGHWFSKKKAASMVEVLEKIKAELMILGFISLLLTVGQGYIAKICIPERVTNNMLPCKRKGKFDDADKHRRRLLNDHVFPDFGSSRRFLAGEEKEAPCSPGMVSFVSEYGIHQLHIFIFYLAIFHVFSSALIMGLGRAKIRRWKDWEKETESIDYKFSTDPSRFNIVGDITFVKQHVSCWNRNAVLLYITSFFRQFFRSVRKVDYLTIRHGFISAHLSPGKSFNFQKYIKRSLEDDFKVVVSISLPLWVSAILLLLLTVEGWHALFWISFIPLAILLAVGTKLQAIITKMAIEIKDRHVVVQGIPQVSLSDHHFWFGRPHLVLNLIHFTLFQNAFQLIYFLWIWNKFGIYSCYHEKIPLLITRICLGVFVQLLCSYVTLPLYALVSQLGTHMKDTIFDEHTNLALKDWHRRAQEQLGKGIGTSSKVPSASPDASPLHSLHNYRSIHRSNPTTTGAGRRGQDEGRESSGLEIQTPPLDAPVSRSLGDDIEFGSVTRRTGRT